MHPKDTEGLANSVDPDQTAPKSSLIWVCTVCSGISIRKLRIITVDCWLHTVKDRIFQVTHMKMLTHTCMLWAAQWYLTSFLLGHSKKNYKKYVLTGRTLISLHFHAVWSESLPYTGRSILVLDYPWSTHWRLIRPCRCTGWSKSSVDAPNFVSFPVSPLTLHFIQNSHFFVFSLI